jgi:hypothetical protein
MVFRRALPIVVVAIAALTPQPARAAPHLEAQVMAKIRAYRSAPIVVHSGLLGAAREHSRGMSMRGGLDHNGADGRVANASPDPVETNGAPDDGFGVASWCENVTYVMSHPEHEVADRVFNAWEGSGAHGRCMKEGHRNVGAVGIHYDGQSWWATFIAQVDRTAPGGAQPAPAKREPAEEPKPSFAPAASDPPDTNVPAPQEATAPVGLLSESDDAPAVGSDEAADTGQTPVQDEEPAEPERVPAVAAPTQERASSVPIDDLDRARPVNAVGYGWQEVAAVAALLALATPLLRRLRERPSEVEGRDRIALAQIEPVRPCALSAGIERYVVAARVPSDLREMVVQPLAVST